MKEFVSQNQLLRRRIQWKSEPIKLLKQIRLSLGIDEQLSGLEIDLGANPSSPEGEFLKMDLETPPLELPLDAPAELPAGSFRPTKSLVEVLIDEWLPITSKVPSRYLFLNGRAHDFNLEWDEPRNRLVNPARVLLTPDAPASILDQWW